MNSQNDFDPTHGDERLDDALLREHARAGSGADERFLSQLEHALDAQPTELDSNGSARRKPSASRRFLTVGIAASVALAAGITAWSLRSSRVEGVMPDFASNLGNESKQGIPRSRLNSEPEAMLKDVAKLMLSSATSGKAGQAQGYACELRARQDGAFAPANAQRGGIAIPKSECDLDIRQTDRPMAAPVDRERYGQLVDNPWRTPVDQALSTFSIDVDTASYTNLRRMLNDGSRIPKDSVRLEEMVNYFDYAYTPPADDQPFAVHVGNATCPWNPDHQLVRVALKGREIARAQRAPANLVFLLDVSGSMNEPRKLPLVIQAFQLLTEELNESDTLSIVVYAGAEGLALPPTACDAEGRKRIAEALGKLSAGGSTNGGAGIKLAYKLAKEHFKPGGINRVILATDGDFNVGVTEDGGLVSMVEKEAKSNVFLTVLGFGAGNLNDGMLEAITNKGNGVYHYIDTLQEARRVFLEKLMGTLVTIAKDVKIQIEFNPAQVKQYRLLGYADRMLNKEDFSNDKIDAGDIGSGHTVTAFYEVETGDGRQTPPAEALRYQANPQAKNSASDNREWLTVKLRYKQPEGDRSSLIEQPFVGSARGFDQADTDFRFAASVAMTGMLLREADGLSGVGFVDAARIAEHAIGADPRGQRAEFIGMLKQLTSKNQ